MTGMGGIPYDRAEAYQILDRACRGGHGGACHLQAQMLCARPGSLGKNVPSDPHKAMQLYQHNCDEYGDQLRCEPFGTKMVTPDDGDCVHTYMLGLQFERNLTILSICCSHFLQSILHYVFSIVATRWQRCYCEATE